MRTSPPLLCSPHHCILTSNYYSQRLQNHLRKLLPKNGNSEDKVLVFALYKKEAARVETLLKRSYAVTALHGDMSQVHPSPLQSIANTRLTHVCSPHV